MSNYRQKIYASYRTNNYIAKNSGDIESTIENYRFQFQDLLPKDKNAKILDIGCGSGFLVNFLVKEGYKNVLGIDNSPEQVEFGQSQNLPVIQAEAIEFLKENKGFDLIISTDVIEHLKKDEIIDFLERIYEALAENGYSIIRTGNVASIYATTSRYIDFTHEIGFTEDSLRQVLLVCGFNKILISDNKAKFGWKPKRLLRWSLLKVWRGLLSAVYTLEVGENKPRLFGKLLIAQAYKLPTDG